MRKIMMILAAMAVLMSSCSKVDLMTEPVSVKDKMVLKITVAVPGVETKALIKNDWANGDLISIWYDDNTSEDPNVVIKYDGSQWTQDNTAETTEGTPKTSGYVKALYNGDVKVASKDEYAFANNILSFSIENWKFLSEIQMVVTGLTNIDADKYTLACDKFTPITGYSVSTDAIMATTGTKGAAVTGISNTDGVAFVFATADYSTSSTAYEFTLKSSISGSEWEKVYTADTAIAATEDLKTIKALITDSTNFTEAEQDYVVNEPEYVEMKMGTGTNEYKLKWATCNLGATNGNSKETWYGNLYSWGNVTGQSGDEGFDSGFASDKYPTTEGYKIEESEDWIKAEHDAAYKEFGGNWRMPTSQEFRDLYDACGGTSGSMAPASNGSVDTTAKGIYWCTNYDGVPGLNGILFHDGTNKLFFPAAGDSDSDSRSLSGTNGHYWSSSLFDGRPYDAFRLYFYSNEVVGPRGCNYRYRGSSIRPVSD